MTRRDVAARERRARLRDLQAPPEPEPFDWVEAAKFWGVLLLCVVVGVPALIAFAWVVGMGVDWLTEVLK